MQAQKGDILGPVKIKDGLFIGDELAAQVTLAPSNILYAYTNLIGSRIRCHEQSFTYRQLRSKADTKPLGNHWHRLSFT